MSYPLLIKHIKRTKFFSSAVTFVQLLRLLL